MGDRVVFPRLGIGDRQVADKLLFMRYLSVSPVPNLGKTTRSSQSDITPRKLTLSNPVSQQGDCLTVVKVPSFSIFLKENSPKICFVNLLANFFFGSEMNLIHINICSLPLLNSFQKIDK